MTTYANPGAIGNMPPTPNKVESTWGNAIRDRVVNNFDTVAHRDAAIGSPVIGQACYCADVDALLVYAGATDGWRAPWNLPWGLPVLPAVGITTQASISATTLLTSSSLTFTAVANRQYKLTATVAVTKATTSDVLLTLRDGSSVEKARSRETVADTFAGFLIGIWYETYSAGSITRQLALQAASGTVSTSAMGVGSGTVLTLGVEDIGPSGSPS